MAEIVNIKRWMAKRTFAFAWYDKHFECGTTKADVAIVHVASSNIGHQVTNSMGSLLLSFAATFTLYVVKFFGHMVCHLTYDCSPRPSRRPDRSPTRTADSKHCTYGSSWYYGLSCTVYFLLSTIIAVLTFTIFFISRGELQHLDI